MISSVNKNCNSAGTGVTSVFGRVGAVVAVAGDYNTSQVTESGNLYYTNARGIGSTLTGYTSGAGVVSATDTILQAIQKLNGNISAIVSGVSSVSGTANRISVSPTTGAVVVDISATYVGQTSITTLGTIGTGMWQGTAIADAYISSAATWNAKQAALSGTGVVYSAAGVISYYSTTGSGTVVALGTSPTFTTDITSPIIYFSSIANGSGTIKVTSHATTTSSILRINQTGGGVHIGATNGTAFAGLALQGGSSSPPSTRNLGWDYDSASANSRRWWFTNDWNSYGDFAILTESTQGNSTPVTANTKFYISTTGNIGIGTTNGTVSAKTHIISTTEQLRLAYDTSNYMSTTVSSTGGVTWTQTGTAKSFDFGSASNSNVTTFNASSGTGTFSIQGLIGTTSQVALYVGVAKGSETSSNYFTKWDGNIYLNSQSTTAGLLLSTGDSAKVTIQPGSTTSADHTLFQFRNRTALTTTANVKVFRVAASTQTWATGTVPLVYNSYFETQTLAAAAASVFTAPYGLFVEKNTVGTNATFTNNWALGTNGNVFFAGDDSQFYTLKITQASSQTTIGATGSSVAAIWMGTTSLSHSTGNYALRADGTNLHVNAALTGGSLFFNTAATTYMTMTSSSLTFANAFNLISNTSTGTKIGTATNQKWGFFNATPIVQPSGDVVTALQNLGLIASGTIGAITGTTTNDNAASGIVGEYISSNITSGSAVSLTTATATNVTSISLTAGDWDVEGIVNFSTTGASSSDFKAGSNSTSATFGGDNTWANMPLVATGLSDVLSENIPVQRFSLSATTTVYLIANATFTLGTVSAYGLLRARRVR